MVSYAVVFDRSYEFGVDSGIFGRRARGFEPRGLDTAWSMVERGFEPRIADGADGQIGAELRVPRSCAY